MISPRLLPLLAAAVSLSALRAEKIPLISKEAALQSLEANGAIWKQAIAAKSPRLFFSAAEWPEVAKQINEMPEPRAALVKSYFDSMDHLVAEPVPVYQTPEQMVGKSGDAPSLYAAQEELWEREAGNKIFALAVAARLKPDGPYKAKMHDLVMAALAFNTWGRAKPPMSNNSDLAAGHITRGIAVAYDWFRTAFTDEERQKIRKVIAERVPSLLAGLYGTAFWAGGYEENHNHVSVAGLGFCGVAFYDEIPDAPQWLSAARLDFQNVGKALAGDGSSVEGASYWGYGMSFILQYIEATRPIIDSANLYQTPFLKNAAAFRLMAATPGLLGVLPWGDSVVRGWSSPHFILYRLAAQYNDPAPAWFADHLPNPKGGADERTLNMLWARNAPTGGRGPTALDGHLWVNDMVNSRTGWAADDYILCVKGGPTNRNHGHLDAGALAIAFGEEWLLAAPGYGLGAHSGAYWDSTPNGKRWTFFANATESHSTLLINGQNQSSARDARGTVTQFFSAPQWMWTSLDLSQAYHDVTKVTRQVLHRRGEYILVFDSVTTPQPATVEWLSQFRIQPKPERDNGLLIEGRNGQLRVRMLVPDAPLALRKPTVANVDVKASYLTYALSGSGTQTNFVALLQPLKAAAQTPVLKTTLESASPDHTQLTISGEDWTDQLARATPTGSLTLGKSTAIADLAVVRTKGEIVDSSLALNATALSIPGFTLAAKLPCDIAVEKSADGSWLVTASRDVKNEVTADDGKPIRVTISVDNAGKK
ncbi:hypothetical protein BH09VER1_BH09VER1_19280 [soil metagenome]